MPAGGVAKVAPEEEEGAGAAKRGLRPACRPRGGRRGVGAGGRIPRPSPAAALSLFAKESPNSFEINPPSFLVQN